MRRSGSMLRDGRVRCSRACADRPRARPDSGDQSTGMRIDFRNDTSAEGRTMPPRGSVLAAVVAFSWLLFSVPALAATFVYVSNAEDGEIGMYTLQSDGSLQAGPRVKAEKPVMPMTVSADKRFLIAGVRSKPFSAYTYSIDRGSGALKLVGTGTLAESFPYIVLDRTGRFLLGASYG